MLISQFKDSKDKNNNGDFIRKLKTMCWNDHTLFSLNYCQQVKKTKHTLTIKFNAFSAIPNITILY